VTPSVQEAEALVVPAVGVPARRQELPAAPRLPGLRRRVGAALAAGTYDVWIAVAIAGVLSLAIALGPPGVDASAHRYLTNRFSVDGWRFWDNYWYAGRYEFVNYSLLFYPLASFFGLLEVAVVAVTAGAGLFSAIVMRQWGAPARWSSRLFAVSWPAVLVAGQYPFALGAALALAALLALQRGRPLLLLLAALGSLLASPLAFLLLAVLFVGLALAHADPRALTRLGIAPVAAFVLLGVVELLVFRAFPAGGDFPYPLLDLFGITAFSLCGLAFAWGSERTRLLAGVFVANLALGWAAKLWPSALGGNATRLLDYASAPLLVLVIALRGFRPRAAAVVALGVAIAWQVTPVVKNAIGISTEQADAASFWKPAIAFVADPAHNSPDFRVEVVATWGHWESSYLAGRHNVQIPRGWYRQDDFPQNTLFYRGELEPAAYRAWLRSVAVRYVLLPHDTLDPSARAEARLLLSGRSGLRELPSSSPHWSIFELPAAQPILTAPPGATAAAAAATRVLRLGSDWLVVWAPSAGTYRLRVRYNPYWRVDDPTTACVARGPLGMSQLVVSRPGPVRISFSLSPSGVASAVGGSSAGTCSAPPLVPAS
jgi:hypothetical protein